MGIRGVWSTFRNQSKTIDPLKLQPLKIGRDMFCLIYTHRVILDELLLLIKSWSEIGHSIVCVWDGAAPKEKEYIINERRSARDIAVGKKEDLEVYLAEHGDELSISERENISTTISSLGWQGWHLTGKLKREIHGVLGGDIKHISAEGEADDLLLKMAFDGRADVIMSLDSDLFVMGTPRIWRLLNIRKKWIVEDISVEYVCNDWGITLAGLQDASFLAGWDRCHTKGGEFMRFDSALARVKHYGTWQATIAKHPWNESVIINGADDELNRLKSESKKLWVQLLMSRRNLQSAHLL